MRPDKTLQAGDHFSAGCDVSGVNLGQNLVHQVFARVDFRLKTSTTGFSFKFDLPIRPGKITAPQRIFGIRPGEARVHDIPHCPPKRGRFTKWRRRIRVVTVGLLTRENRARQCDVHFQPARMGMRCDIVSRPCRGRNSGPKCLNKQSKRQINLPPGDRFARVERLNIDIALCERHETEPVLALERKRRDGTSEAIRPTMQNFWSRVAHNLNLCRCDVFHHDRRIHVLGQGTIGCGPPALLLGSAIILLARKPGQQSQSPSSPSPCGKCGSKFSIRCSTRRIASSKSPASIRVVRSRTEAAMSSRRSSSLAC